jgi:DNA-binding CsgD family transcriptional regulator
MMMTGMVEPSFLKRRWRSRPDIPPRWTSSNSPIGAEGGGEARYSSADALLLDAVARAIARDVENRAVRARHHELHGRYERLTPREREVFAHLISGQLNKQVGFDLGITERTIKIHRHQVLEKMEAHSIADLVRMAADLGIAPTGKVRRGDRSARTAARQGQHQRRSAASFDVSIVKPNRPRTSFSSMTSGRSAHVSEIGTMTPAVTGRSSFSCVLYFVSPPAT